MPAPLLAAAPSVPHCWLSSPDQDSALAEAAARPRLLSRVNGIPVRSLWQLAYQLDQAGALCCAAAGGGGGAEGGEGRRSRRQEGHGGITEDHGMITEDSGRITEDHGGGKPRRRPQEQLLRLEFDDGLLLVLRAGDVVQSTARAVRAGGLPAPMSPSLMQQFSRAE